MKKLYTLSLIALLTTFSNSSSSADFTPEEQTRLEEIKTNWEGLPNIPEESHSDYNKIKGVDGNGNNIRDDWELTNALASYPNKDEFTLLNQVALNNNLMIDAYGRGDDSSLISLSNEFSFNSFCYGAYYNYKNTNIRSEMVKNTLARENYYNKWGVYLAQILPSNIEFPTYDVLETECPKLLEKSK